MYEQSSGAASDFDLKWNLLVADAWGDDALMKRLLADPVAVLNERGIRVAKGVTVKIFADNDTTAHLIVPQKPEMGELSEEELSTVSAGHSHHHHGSVGIGIRVGGFGIGIGSGGGCGGGGFSGGGCGGGFCGGGWCGGGGGCGGGGCHHHHHHHSSCHHFGS